MKLKLRILTIFLALTLGFTLVGCTNNDSEKESEAKEETKTETNQETQNEEDKEETKNLEKITAIVALKSSKEMLELKRDELAAEGYDLEVKEITDYNLFNEALNNKEGDVSFGVHELYINFFNDKSEGTLVKVGGIYDAVCAFYSPKYKTIDEIEEGVKVFLPNDPVNKSRALRLLEANKLLTFNDDAEYIVDLKDIKDNVKNFEFTEVALDQLIPAYEEPDVGLVWFYPAYSSKIDLYPDKDGLIVEQDFDPKYSIMLAAREDNKDDTKVQLLMKLMQTKEVADYINTELKGEAVPAFEY